MSLNLYRAEILDARRRSAGKVRSRRAQAMVLTIVGLLLIASAFGVMYPYPIHGYGPVF